MVKEEYKNIIKKRFKFRRKTLKLFLQQIKYFEDAEKNYKLPINKYNVNDMVMLKKGTFLHGTRIDPKNVDVIIENGFLSNSVFNKGVGAQKTPYCVSMWNIQNDILLKDYVNLYSGMTIKYKYISDEIKTKLVPYDSLDKEIEDTRNEKIWMWTAEQTKEIRFMPSLIRDDNQLAFIINTESEYARKIIENDIFNPNFDGKIIKTFISKWFIKNFINANRDDFTTNRESAVIFGIPSCFIEGLLVGRMYEKDEEIIELLHIKFPNCYICNLDGVVIK